MGRGRFHIFFNNKFIWIMLMLYTEIGPFAMLGSCQTVCCGGWWWWVVVVGGGGSGIETNFSVKLSLS